jgi:ABC-type polysaccharide/polyol phosphate transport system ATPase subunit
MDRVELDRVSKRYVLGEQRNAREALSAAARRLVRRERDEKTELWSLREVSFSVGDGEALGIVGRNGAGKSTVLKILAGITEPTLGVSRTRGRVAALLEVGTGFHPELTGRENVYLNGAILGMSRRDIIRRFDQIVDFSGTEQFLDTPIKRFSTGMQLRLAFAVAAHLEPDVLVVDEVLAVGDAEFQRKCLGRMTEAGDEGRTVVFVSHDLEALARICRRAVWLDSGRIRESGPTADIVRGYLASGLWSPDSSWTPLRSGPVTVRAVRILSPAGTPGTALMRDEPVRIRVEFDLAQEVRGLVVNLFVTTQAGLTVLDAFADDDGLERVPPGAYCADLTIPPVLNVGDYSLGLWMGSAQEKFIDEPAVVPFTLGGTAPDGSEGLLVMDLPFAVRPLLALP